MELVSEAPAGLEFGRFKILPQRWEVLADGGPLQLGGRAFDVLVALIDANGAVVSKDELMRRVWQGRIAEAARFDGIFVLRTNARLTPLQAVLRHRDLVRVENCSAAPKRCCAPGRSFTPATRRSVVTCSARFCHCCCKSAWTIWR